jgi:hypothetical protein
MQYLSNSWLGLVLLAWAVLSVIWLTLALGTIRDAREDAAAARKTRDFHRELLLKREQQMSDLLSVVSEKNSLISSLSFELDRLYVAEIARVPAPDLRSNVDKVLDYYAKA